MLDNIFEAAFWQFLSFLMLYNREIVLNWGGNVLNILVTSDLIKLQKQVQ